MWTGTNLVLQPAAIRGYLPPCKEHTSSRWYWNPPGTRQSWTCCSPTVTASQRVNFFILDENGSPKAYTDWSDPVQTLNVTEVSAIQSEFQLRSGGMVVITVLLSVVLFILVVCLPIALILEKKKSPAS
uniref:Uroplakin-3a-like n=1 Tax=Geotrypetes seraphini TaxID=260995 RepID=A0A6P8RU06_GEOSA|nr:uroplakin-3a-like [Geotrypetes seraphini]